MGWENFCPTTSLFSLFLPLFISIPPHVFDFSFGIDLGGRFFLFGLAMDEQARRRFIHSFAHGKEEREEGRRYSGRKKKKKKKGWSMDR